MIYLQGILARGAYIASSYSGCVLYSRWADRVRLLMGVRHRDSSGFAAISKVLKLSGYQLDLLHPVLLTRPCYWYNMYNKMYASVHFGKHLSLLSQWCLFIVYSVLYNTKSLLCFVLIRCVVIVAMSCSGEQQNDLAFVAVYSRVKRVIGDSPSSVENEYCCSSSM